jgi:alkanesulfonate monooxygenase SsuD/methylene tetrahydromethanopterin reductase-like flavin-dependent oxidoreductase (luciferase family)
MMVLKSLMFLSENSELLDPRDLGAAVEAAAIVEAAGIDGIAFGGHLVMGRAAQSAGPKFNPRDFDGIGNHDPAAAHPSTMVMLGAVAARTTRIGIHACAILPVLTHPLQVAKDLATLDVLTKGRLVVWPTVSWQEQEYDAIGVPFHKRGKMLDEHLAIWREVWANSPASYEGEFYRFQDIWVEPKPWRPEGPPIWITGNELHAAALRRLVKYGSAFAPIKPVSPQEHARIREAFEAAGRDPTTLVFTGGFRGRFGTPDGLADLEQAFGAIAPQAEAGARIFLFKPSQFIRRLDELSGLCARVVARLKAETARLEGLR